MKSTQSILALDVATVTGWMTSDGKSGALRLKGDTEQKLEQLAEFVEQQIRRVSAKVVAYEEASYGAGGRKGQGGVQWSTIAFHQSMRSQVRLIAKRLGAEPQPVNILTAKKIATGNGRAKKDQVMRCFRLFVGREPIDDNEADAWAVMVAAQQGAFMKKKPRKARPKKGVTVVTKRIPKEFLF